MGEHGRGIPDKYIDTVYNGTDFVDFKPSNSEPIHEEFGVPTDRTLVGLVGRVCREKGHLLMVDAMKDVLKEHPGAHLMFIGRVERMFDAEVREAMEGRKSS
mgnify:CR=1 FL=1